MRAVSEVTPDVWFGGNRQATLDLEIEKELRAV